LRTGRKCSLGFEFDFENKKLNAFQTALYCDISKMADFNVLGDFSLTWGPATPTARPATSPIDVSNLVLLKVLRCVGFSVL